MGTFVSRSHAKEFEAIAALQRPQKKIEKFTYPKKKTDRQNFKKKFENFFSIFIFKSSVLVQFFTLIPNIYV